MNCDGTGLQYSKKFPKIPDFTKNYQNFTKFPKISGKLKIYVSFWLVDFLLIKSNVKCGEEKVLKTDFTLFESVIVSGNSWNFWYCTSFFSFILGSVIAFLRVIMTLLLMCMTKSCIVGILNLKGLSCHCNSYFVRLMRI